MSREEFARLISAIKAYYQNDELFTTQESTKLWYAELEDIDFKTAALALRRYVQTNKFPPTIADIRASVAETVTPDDEWSKGWEQVLNAIRKYGYIAESEALESFDEVTRECVKRLGWKEICHTKAEQTQVQRANFRMVYEQIANHRKDIMKLSSDVAEEIKKLKLGYRAKAITSGNGEG